MGKISAVRYHDICAGHRVVGHESKCKNLHGHNYRFWFYVRPFRQLLGDPDLDSIGRVIDFSVIKSTLADWLEVNWDHKMLLWEKDVLAKIRNIENIGFDRESFDMDEHGVVIVPFNPTAENMARYFVEVIAPKCLDTMGVELYKLIIEETRKCSVVYEKD
jgi:6-pyruvoyltetrahydropterin/6-carboxytetrahydropterin synthase